MAILPTGLMDCGQNVLICAAQYVTTVTGGLYWTFAILGFGLVLFIASQRFGTARAYGFASVMTMFLAIGFSVINLIDWYYSAMFILAGAIGFVVLIMNKS